MKKAAIILVVIIIVGVGGFFGVQRVSGAQATPIAQPTIAPVQPAASVIAEGSVAPAQDANLAFAAGGMVAEVLVEEGQTVQAGQTLARLSGSQPQQAALSAAELEVLTAQQSLDDLTQNLSLERAQAEQAVAQAQTAYHKAKDHREGMNYPRGTQVDIDNAWSKYQLALTNVALAQDQYDRARNFKDDNLIKNQVINALTAAQLARDQALATYNWLTGVPTQEDLNTADADLAVAKAKLDDAKAQLAKIQYGPDAEQEALLQARLKSANDQAAAARANLANLEVKAPFAGTVTSVAIAAGEFAQPGMTVARLADTSSWLVRTSDLTELNVGAVEPGATVAVKLDALPGEQFSGKVESIEAYGENHQSDIVYTVVIRLDQADPRLRWNMSAVVTFPEVAQ